MASEAERAGRVADSAPPGAGGSDADCAESWRCKCEGMDENADAAGLCNPRATGEPGAGDPGAGDPAAAVGKKGVNPPRAAAKVCAAAYACAACRCCSAWLASAETLAEATEAAC